MNLIPWLKKDKIVTVEDENKSDIVVIQSSKLTAAKPISPVVQVRRKSIVIGGKKFNVDPHALMRMVMQVTQEIGEYKDLENPMALYSITGLRRVRQDI